MNLFTSNELHFAQLLHASRTLCDFQCGLQPQSASKAGETRKNANRLTGSMCFGCALQFSLH